MNYYFFPDAFSGFSFSLHQRADTNFFATPQVMTMVKTCIKFAELSKLLHQNWRF